MTLLTAGGLASALALATPAFAAVTPRDNGVTKQVSMDTDAVHDANYPSTRARISQSGDYVAFQSVANNMTALGAVGTHVYFTDLTIAKSTGTGPTNGTSLVDVNAAGTAKCTQDGATGTSTFNEVSNAVAGDGPWVVFASTCNDLVTGWTHPGDVYRRNMGTGVTEVVSAFPGSPKPISTRPVVSDNGRYVAWNTTNGDVWLRDMQTSDMVRVTAGGTGPDSESLRPEISGDGSHLVFASDAKLEPAVDRNSHRDVYLVDVSAWLADHSVTTFTPQIVSVTGSNGARVVASSPASRPGINGNGTIITFESAAPNLVEGDTNAVSDAFWRDTTGGRTVLVSQGYAGGVVTGGSSRPQVDDSGYVVGFVSVAHTIVRGDTNKRTDAFIRKLDPTNPSVGTNYMISVTPSGAAGGDTTTCPLPAPPAAAPTGGFSAAVTQFRQGQPDISTRPYLNGDASRVVFVSGMCNLVNPVKTYPAGDTQPNQVYVRDYSPGGPVG